MTITGTGFFASDVTVSGFGKLVLDGQFVIQGTMNVINGGELVMEAGSSLLFDGTLSNKLYVGGSSKTEKAQLTINGDEGNPVTIGALDDDGRSLWYGIEIGKDCEQVIIENADIRNARYGVTPSTAATNTSVQVLNSRIHDCYIAVDVRNPYTLVQGGEIFYCNYGFNAVQNSQVVNPVYYVVNVHFHDIDVGAIGAGSVYRLGVFGCTVESTGRRGLTAIGVGDLQLGPYNNTIPNTFRYIGSEAYEQSDGVVSLSSSTNVRMFYKNQIYDNAPAGLWIENSTMKDENWNKENLIANNGLGIESYPHYSTQILFRGGYGLNLSEQKNDVFASKLTDLGSDHYLLSNVDSPMQYEALEIQNVYWGAEPAPMQIPHEWLAGLCYPYGWADYVIPVGLIYSSHSHGDDASYWGYTSTSSVDTDVDSLYLAFQMLDSLARELDARNLFLRLAQSGELEAINGFIAADRSIGATPEATANILANLPSMLDDTTFFRTCRYAIGEVYRSRCLYDDAIDRYQSIADNPIDEVDSLLALIEIQRTQEMSLTLAEPENGSAQVVQSNGDVDRAIGLIEAQINDYNILIAERGKAQNQGENMLPSRFGLTSLYPNPFNPSINIEFDVPTAHRVQLVVYNILGRQVETIFDQVARPGVHKVIWNSNQNGKLLASGVYFIQMKAPGFIGTKK